MGGFLLGCMVGGTVGVVTMCMCSAASAADRHCEDIERKMNK